MAIVVKDIEAMGMEMDMVTGMEKAMENIKKIV
jgi:hypothetical protein